MAKFAFIFPRQWMVKTAERIAQDLGMEVVLNQYIATQHALDTAEEARRLGADILIARGTQASILKSGTDFPVVEIQLTGQEIALLLRRAKDLVPQIRKPKIGMVTIPNMVGSMESFEQIFDIELHTYFAANTSEMEPRVEQAVADEMDVILGGDLVNAYCRRLGKQTLFFDGTEDSIRTTLLHARSMGFAADAERRNTAHLQVLLDYSFNGILELDAAGNIVQANDMACKLLDRPRKALSGKPLTDLMSPEDMELWANALTHHQELYFTALELAGIRVVANAAPVPDGNAGAGMVVSFYEMNKMERQGANALRERYRLHRYLAQGRFEDIRHSSPDMKRLIRTARSYAETLQPILLLGETGCGKDLFAQSIHNASTSAQGPFVPFACAAGWQDQAAALSAAAKDASGGTLFISSVDLLGHPAQYVLLRLLEQAVVQIRPEELPTPVNVRVIAAMDGQLLSLAEAGRLRWDLYYLLAPMSLELPPLRKRREDLEQAIDMCLDDCVTRLSRYTVLTKEARRLLLEYPWPGNYIQLSAFIQRMVLTAPSRTIHDGYIRQLLKQLYPAPASCAPVDSPPSEAAVLEEVLRRNNGSRSAAAAELGISKTTLWRRMKRHGITGR